MHTLLTHPLLSFFRSLGCPVEISAIRGAKLSTLNQRTTPAWPLAMSDGFCYSYFGCLSEPIRSRFTQREVGQVELWMEAPNKLSAGVILPPQGLSVNYYLSGKER